MEHTLRGRACIVTATGILSIGISGLEDYNMHRVHRYVSSLFLAAALVAPMAITAHARRQDDRRQEERRQDNNVRYYDRDHHDYHTWDNREDRAYRNYLVEQHRGYRSFTRTNHRVQRNYWNWRHSHPDRD
jgi:hypothetical protein